MIARRTLLAVSLLGWPGTLARAGDVIEEARITLAGIEVPAVRARLLATVKLGGMPVAVLAFAADLADGVRDLFAVVAGGRVVALEVLAWHGTNGERLSTQVSAVSDRLRLRLQREASAPRGRGYRREQWTDYLGWQGAAPLADAPVRPVLAGTWQAALAAQRAEMRAVLTVGPRGVAPALVAACPPPVLAV